MLARHKLAEARRTDDVARIGLAMVDILRKELTPHRLQAVQDALRAGLRNAQHRLTNLAPRRTPRRARLLRLCGHRDGFGRFLGDANRAFEEYDGFVRLQRDILRQVGDAVAWLVLGLDPHRIVPLFDDRRVHTLSSGVGAAGPIQVQLELHDSGRFLVLESDLARCVGAGDLIVVRSDQFTPRPLIVEVKTHGTLPDTQADDQDGSDETGTHLSIECITPVSPNPQDVALQQDFEQVITAKIIARDAAATTRARPPSGIVSDRQSRQEADLVQRAERLMRASVRPHEILERRGRSTWRTLRNVLERALQTGAAIDTPEPGIAMLALRVHGGLDARNALDALFQRGQDLGLVAPDAHRYTSADLRQHALLSPLVPPVPLWPLPAPLRAALLAGDLFYICAIDAAVWARAFAAVGLQLTEDRREWVINKGSEQVRANRVEVAKVRLGVAFGGYSPRDIAERMARAL